MPGHKIYEDDDFIVILDIFPATDGHALIIPKAHYTDAFELPDELSAKVLPLAKKIADAQREVLSPPGFNIVQCNGVAAGQTVFHYHLHVIPRYDSGKDIVTWNQRQEKTESLEKTCAAVTGKLDGLI